MFPYKELRSRTRSGTQRHTIIHATSVYNGKTIPTGPIFKNVIDCRKWKGKPQPKHWPAHLEWPNDAFKAILYSKTPRTIPTTRKPSIQQQSVTPWLKTDLEPCHSTACPNPYPRSRNPDSLCKYTSAPWDHRNNASWFSQKISLQRTAQRGIGAHTLTSFPQNTVIGEYVGELIPTSPLAHLQLPRLPP